MSKVKRVLLVTKGLGKSGGPSISKTDSECRHCGNENIKGNYMCDFCSAEFCDQCHPGSGSMCTACGEELA